jgi:ElaB/YqjD/DUF883 family membrane-anchored ribosome-binding protein
MARVYQSGAHRSVETMETVPVTLEEGRVSWGGVWSGFLFGMGVLLLLSTLGLAIGVSAADIPQRDLNSSGLGIGAAVWSGASLLIALFVGGLVATRVGMVFDRTAGMIQGALVWVLAILGIIYLAASGISLVTSSAFSLLSGVTRQVGAAVTGTAELGDLASGDVNQILARLRDPQTAKTIAAATGMSQQEIESKLSSIQARVEAAKDNPEQAAAEAKQGLQEFATQAGKRAESAAAKAQPYASAATWTTLGAMVLSLIAAIVGALVGARRAAVRVGVA